VPSHPVILLKAIWTIADKRKYRMAQHNEDRPIGEVVELLKTNGFDGLAEAVTVLLNSAMVAERSEHLGASIYSREVIKEALSINAAAVIFPHNQCM
jgi:hypothetical protein